MARLVMRVSTDEERTINTLVKEISKKDHEISKLATKLTIARAIVMERILPDNLISEFEPEMLMTYAKKNFSTTLNLLEIDEDEIEEYISGRKEVISDDND